MHGIILPDKMSEKECKVCGKRFVYYPRWWQWLAKVNGKDLTAVCTYTCMRKVEREQIEKQKRLDLAADKSSTSKEPTRRRLREKSWYEAEIAKNREETKIWAERINKGHVNGKWRPEIDRVKRKAWCAKLRYCRDRANTLQHEYDIVYGGK